MSEAYVHPSALVEDDVEIGEGTKIWHHCHVRHHVVLGKDCNLGKNVYVDFGVTIGDGTKIQNNVSLYHGLEVGSRVFIGPSAVFTNDLTPRAFLWDDERLVKTKVEEGVAIGANATIVCGTTIGQYAMVGAGSVVTHDVPAHVLVYGNPARTQGYVCICGARLPVAVGEQSDSCECEKCGSTYRVEANNQISIIKDTSK